MSSRDDEQTELLRQIREQLATLHEALSLATEVLAQGVDALATSVDETNVRVDEIHAKLDTVTRQTHDYIARLDRNAVRANRQRLDLALEPLDLGPIEEFVRSSDEPDGRTPDSGQADSGFRVLEARNPGMVRAAGLGHTGERRPMDSHDNETTNELLRMMWQQLVAINQRGEGTNSRLDVAVERLDTRIGETNLTLKAFMRQTHDNFDRVDRNVERVAEGVDATNTRLDAMHASLSSRLDATKTRLDAMHASLSSRIDETNTRLDAMHASLSSRIDETNAGLKDFKQQTHENFGRVHRNHERMHTRLEVIETGDARMNELDARLTRVEAHVGLRDE